MKIGTSALIFTLLITGILAQSSTINSPVYYGADNTVYQNTYGSGSAVNVSLGDRSTSGSSQLQGQLTASGISSNNQIPNNVIPCPYLQVYNNILCQCVCILGYHFQGTNCVQNYANNSTCPDRQTYSDGRCICAQGYFQIGLYCDICPPYSAYDPSSLSCYCITGYSLVNGQCLQIYTSTPLPVPKPIVCGINQQLVGGNCICLNNYYLIQGVCTLCVAPNYFDLNLQICRPNCTSSQVLDLQTLTCICVSGFYNVQGVCGSCPAYSTYNKYTKTCDCVTGYSLSKGKCVVSTYTPVPIGPLPVPASLCSDPNQVFVNQQCICKKGYYLIQGVCQQCPGNLFYDPALAICRISCPTNEVFNTQNSTCNCIPNYNRNTNGTCITCLGNTTYNSTSKQCGCPAGYNLAGNYCVVGCGINQVLNNGVCCCKTGYYPVNGICGQCDWNQIYDQGLGICRKPCDSTRIWSLSTSSCVCLPQYYQFNDGRCGVCPSSSTYDLATKTCVCNAGFIMSLGLCIPSCNAYQQFVNGACVCLPGYYLIGYSCGICPPNQIYDSIYRICRTGCKTNEVFDATIRICRCLPGYYLVGGICGQCNATSQIYNQRTQCCDCISGYRKISGQGCNGVCVSNCSPFENWIAGRCVCKPGYYYINNMCTVCPEGTVYDVYNRICRTQCGSNQLYDFNSGKCNCAVGFYIVQGICSKCRAGQTYSQYTQTCSQVPCPDIKEYYSNITGTCICLPQYIKIKGVCTNCPPGFYYDSYSDSCLCKPGYKIHNGFCVSVCPTGTSYVNGQCICPNGDLPLNGQCRSIQCPLFSHYDIDTGCCVCNSGYSVIAGVCSDYQYCGENGYQRYGQCYCKQGFFYINNRCKPCGQNEAYNGAACECLNGYTRNVNGVCIVSSFNPNCYNNQRYDPVSRSCVCIDGSIFYNGACVTIPTCPTNSYFNGQDCICQSGYVLSNGVCIVVSVIIPTCPSNAQFNGVSCSCEIGYNEIVPGSGVCGKCGPGTQWDGIQCSQIINDNCAIGYVLNSLTGQCEPAGPSCGANSYWNGATCVCGDSFDLINGKCSQCLTGFTFDGTTCSPISITPSNNCDSNQISVGGKCVCASGFYNINGKCLTCPSGTKWNGVYCDCGCNQQDWCLGQIFSKKINKVCGCQSGYTKINGVCAKSP